MSDKKDYTSNTAQNLESVSIICSGQITAPAVVNKERAPARAKIFMLSRHHFNPTARMRVG